MKKVIIFIPSFSGGGAERVMTNVSRYINKDKFKIYLMVLSDEGPYKDLISEEDNIKVLNLDTIRLRYSIKKIVTTINMIDPDIVLSTMGHLNLILLLLRKTFKSNPKIIVREANTPSEVLRATPFIKKKLYKTLYRFLYPTADKIIAQCIEMKEDMISYYKLPRDKITYIYNPVNIEEINEKVSSTNPFNDKYINFIAAGRLSYQKGFDILLESFSIVLEKYPNSYLTILGKGELEEELIILSKKLNVSEKVNFLGFVNNPYTYFHHADAYVLSSRFEGFPNTLLEAMACNTKVVSTDCKSGPTEILMNGKIGFLANVNDSESLAIKMIESIEGDNKQFNRIRDFDINSIIKEYEDILS